MDTAKHAAQDLWELISGHPTNLKPRPIIHRQNATHATYAHKEVEDPTVVAAHAKSQRAACALVQAQAAELQAGKYGDEKGLKQAKAVRRVREVKLKEAKDEELAAILAANKKKREVREAEKAKAGVSGSKEKEKGKQKIKFQKQKAPSGKVPKGGSAGVVYAEPDAADVEEIPNAISIKASKRSSEYPDKTVVPLASEYNRQLGDNERSYLEGMAENPGSAGNWTQAPSAATARVSRVLSNSRPPDRSQATSSRVPPNSKPPTGNQAKTVMPPDATIPQEKTEFNRPLGDMNRTQLEGMQEPSVVARWNQTNSGSSTNRTPSIRPPSIRQPSSRPPASGAPKTVTPSTPIPQEQSAADRQVGNMNRTYIDGMQPASEVARWNQEGAAQSASRQPPPSRPPTSRPFSSRPPSSKPPLTSSAQTMSPSTPIPQDQTVMGRELGNNNRTHLEGVQIPSEVARWNSTNAVKFTSRPPASRQPTPSRPLASIAPQTVFHNPSILQNKTEMARPLGNNDRTYVVGMTPEGTANQQELNPVILPEPKSEYHRPLGNMQRTVVEGMVPGSQFEDLAKAQKE